MFPRAVELITDRPDALALHLPNYVQSLHSLKAICESVGRKRRRRERLCLKHNRRRGPRVRDEELRSEQL